MSKDDLEDLERPVTKLEIISILDKIYEILENEIKLRRRQDCTESLYAGPGEGCIDMDMEELRYQINKLEE